MVSSKYFSEAGIDELEMSVILRCIKRVYLVGSNKLLCDFLDIDRSNHIKIANAIIGRSKLKPEVTTHILNALDHIASEKLFSSIKAENPDLHKKITRTKLPVTNSLADWVGVAEDQKLFGRLRAGTNGSYYLLRLIEPEKVVCSWMHIKSPNDRDILPKFLTYRHPTGGRQRFVRGAIFQSGNLIYSFGKSRNANGFRATILSPYDRGTDRHDMIGVRLGVQENPDKPFSYPIYCYQLKNPRSRKTIKKTVGVHSLDDFEKLNQVRNFDSVVDILQNAARSPLGASIQDALQGNPNAFLNVELPKEVAAWLAERGETLSEPQPVIGETRVYRITPEMVASNILRSAFVKETVDSLD